MRLRKYSECGLPWYIIDDFLIDEYISTLSFSTLAGAYNIVINKNTRQMTALPITLQHADEILLEIYFDEIYELLELIPEEFL